ncbi:MFS transporter [Streptomyces sp. KLMMK]|uniref:MFS transporter n=1 Tax=Streptomyces sp. KLMMK TaxID=3109353 RepID=UPI002FFEF2F5
MTPRERGGLWRDADFLKFWGVESLSMFGTQISMPAIPLLAATALDAGPFQMGLINAAQLLPYLLFTLLAGAWVDQRRRRPVMIGAHLGRAAVLALTPSSSPPPPSPCSSTSPTRPICPPWWDGINSSRATASWREAGPWPRRAAPGSAA